MVATYFREKAEKRKDLLAFANEARDRFAEAAKQIYEERNRETEEGERSVKINRLISDFKNNHSQFKTQDKFYRVP